MIDWEQAKHTYLLAAMVFLSLVLLTEAGTLRPWFVLIVLAGHAYFAAIEGTFGYLMNLFGGKSQTQPLALDPNYDFQNAPRTIVERQSAFNYNPPSISNWAQPYNELEG